MQGEPWRQEERRRATRVRPHGRVAIHDDRFGGGKLLDLSATGVRARIAGPHALYLVADRVELELRLDGAIGGWWRLPGHIVRIDRDGEVAIEFEATPTDLEDLPQAEHVALLEAVSRPNVLIVDSPAPRRGGVATALRALGHRVREAATPLEAIDQLGESRDHPRVVAIADTVPTGIADDLRRYVRGEHADLALVRLFEGVR